MIGMETREPTLEELMDRYSLAIRNLRYKPTLENAESAQRSSMRVFWEIDQVAFVDGVNSARKYINRFVKQSERCLQALGSVSGGNSGHYTRLVSERRDSALELQQR